MLILLIGFLSDESARAFLREGPEISEVLVDADNSNLIFLRIEHLSIDFASCSNGGMVFRKVPEPDVRDNLKTNLSHGLRRCVIVDNLVLLRSDDGGNTRTNTVARKFLVDMIDGEIEEEQTWF